MPTANTLAHRLHRVATDSRGEVHVHPTILIDRFARLKGVAEKRKLHGRILRRPIDVLAVHNSCFLRMQFESALT